MLLRRGRVSLMYFLWSNQSSWEAAPVASLTRRMLTSLNEVPWKCWAFTSCSVNYIIIYYSNEQGFWGFGVLGFRV
jgi:hypothetical protein